MIEVLAENDHAPKKLEGLAAHPKLKALAFVEVVQTILVLIGARHVHPAQDPGTLARTHCRALNRFVCERARSSGDIQFLASPVTGGGVLVPRFYQFFLLASQLGKKTEAEQVAFAWELLSAKAQRVIKGGKTLESPEENIAELTHLARKFATKRLSVIKALELTQPRPQYSRTGGTQSPRIGCRQLCRRRM